MRHRKSSPTEKLRRRPVVDVSRTRYWYHLLLYSTQCENPTQLERLLEPEAVGKLVDGLRIRRNKWRAYRLGSHTPRPDLVRRVDDKIPGSAEQLNHVFWKIASQGDGLRLTSESSFSRPPAEIHTLLYRRDWHTGVWKPRRLFSRTFRAIERQADLDVLAYLAFMLLTAHRFGNRADCISIGVSFWYSLLIFAQCPWMTPVAEAVFELCKVKLLHLATDGQQKLCPTLEDFQHASVVLANSECQWFGCSASNLSWRDRAKSDLAPEFRTP